MYVGCEYVVTSLSSTNNNKNQFDILLNGNALDEISNFPLAVKHNMITG